MCEDSYFVMRKRPTDETEKEPTITKKKKATFHRKKLAFILEVRVYPDRCF